MAAPYSVSQGRAAKPYIGELDVVRAVACAAVVGVHVLSMVRGMDASQGLTNAIGGMFSTSWHFTREAFMIMTGLVFMYSYGRERFVAGRFYGRRAVERVLPYVLWSVVYVLVFYPHHFNLAWWKHLGWDLLKGSASYQLYAVSVLLQFYLLFPLFAWFMGRFPRSHVWLLLITLAAQIAWYTYVAPMPPSASPSPWVSNNLIRVIFTYPFFFTLGAVVGWHLKAVKSFIDRHARLVTGLAVLTAVAIFTRYVVVVFVRHQFVLMGTYVFEPAMIFWSVGATALLWMVGRHLVHGRLSRLGNAFSRAVMSVSRASYGIFIVHVMFLRWVFAHFAAIIPGGAVVQFLAIWTVTFGLSYALTASLLAIPWVSLTMGGVPWRRPHPAPPAATTPPAGEIAIPSGS